MQMQWLRLWDFVVEQDFEQPTYINAWLTTTLLLKVKTFD